MAFAAAGSLVLLLQDHVDYHDDEESEGHGHHGVVGIDIAVLAFLYGLGEQHEQQEAHEDPRRQRDEEVELRILEGLGHRQVRRNGRYPEEEQRVECELDKCFHNCPFENDVINNFVRC